jgi:phospholipase/lecithinase/hemolysin
MLRTLELLRAALAAVVLTASGTANAGPVFERIVVFGDSLSDGGNGGRYSNGPVWVEHLAEALGLPLTPSRAGGGNFAVGGARLDPRSGPHNLRAQAGPFFGRPSSHGRTLFILWGGGNDLLEAVGSADGPVRIDRAAAAMRSIVADLVHAGATDILIPNLPDIGMTPALQARGSRAAAEAGRLTDRFNAAVDRALAGIAGSPDLRLHRLDVWAMAECARADPAAYDFADVTTPCIDLDACEGYLFWDHVHPTTRAHAHLAEAALRTVLSR